MRFLQPPSPPVRSRRIRSCGLIAYADRVGLRSIPDLLLVLIFVTAIVLPIFAMVPAVEAVSAGLWKASR